MFPRLFDFYNLLANIFSFRVYYNNATFSFTLKVTYPSSIK